jgi:ureidoacrylate peracid hydrolase
MTRPSRTWTLTPDHADLAVPVDAPRPVRLVAEPQDVTIDLARTALVVVDMQNDFCAEGGWLHGIGVDVAPAAAAIAPVNDVTAAMRACDVPIIWLNWGNRPDRRNLPPGVLHVYDGDGTGGGIGARAGRSDAVLTAGSWGAAIVDGVEVGVDDIHVDKYRMSGFFDTPLDGILRGLDVRTILFAGVNADQCVLATLTDAACLGYDVVLIEQASATTSPSYCLDATLYNVRQCFGFTVQSRRLAELASPSRERNSHG